MKTKLGGTVNYLQLVDFTLDAQNRIKSYKTGNQSSKMKPIKAYLYINPLK